MTEPDSFERMASVAFDRGVMRMTLAVLDILKSESNLNLPLLQNIIQANNTLLGTWSITNYTEDNNDEPQKVGDDQSS